MEIITTYFSENIPLDSTFIHLVDFYASKLIIEESVKNYLKKSDKIVQYLSKKKYANLQNFSKLFDYNFIKYDCLRLVSPDFGLKKKYSTLMNKVFLQF